MRWRFTSISEPLAAIVRACAGGKSFRERYLRPALDAGLIAMTRPGKPKSRLQCYYLTALGEIVGQSRTYFYEAGMREVECEILSNCCARLLMPKTRN